MRKPIIGVLPLVDEERDSLWMLPGYLNGIEKAGGIPIILPLIQEEKDIVSLAEICDGFLYTGGHDVDPSLYGEKAINDSVIPCKARDLMEGILLKEARKLKKPILGICRGIQFINAALGGSLYQDLEIQHPSHTNHHMTPPYDRSIHQVEILKDSPLYHLLQEDHMGVNSYHHQAVRNLAPSLKAMAISEDGLIEALYDPSQTFLWAVQWHPEFYKDQEESNKIFHEFVKSCRDN